MYKLRIPTYFIYRHVLTPLLSPRSQAAKEAGPQVYPSTFGGNSAPVVPLEDNSESHFLGPRGLKFNKREAEAEEDEVMSRSRRGLNDELGVLSGYQVISEVDLAFKPSFEDGVGVTVFQVSHT